MERLVKCLIVLTIIFVSASIHANNSIKIPLRAASVSLDPGQIQDSSSLFVARQINCQLVRNQRSIYVFEAAKSIKYISPLEVIVKLNDKITFYDGSPITASDVVASFNYVKRTRNVLRNIFSWVDRVDILDDKTIVFNLKKPIPRFIKFLSSPHNAIFKKDYLALAEKDAELWKSPQGCGGYRVVKSDDNHVVLHPVKNGMKIDFILNKANKISSNLMDKYDIISLGIVGESKNRDQFNKIEIFDPYQVFIGLNGRNGIWENRKTRCGFLSKINVNKLMESYGDGFVPSNDFIPAGILGYSKNERFFQKIEKEYKNAPIKQQKKFCLAYLVVSIPGEYIHRYYEMVHEIYPNVNLMPILDSKQFGQKFVESKCDAILFSLKSDNFDGYEYVDIFANKDANFSGMYIDSLEKQIKNSQDIVDENHKVRQYREIVKRIEDMCVIRPLLSTTMRTIFIKKSIIAPGIGLGSLNDYYLGNVKRR